MSLTWKTVFVDNYMVSPFFMWNKQKSSNEHICQNFCILASDNTIIRSSYLHNGISYTGKTASLYWISHQSSAESIGWLPAISAALAINCRHSEPDNQNELPTNWQSSDNYIHQVAAGSPLQGLLLIFVLQQYYFVIKHDENLQMCGLVMNRLISPTYSQ